MSSQTITTAAVEKATGVRYRTLRRWIVLGLLEQPDKSSDGRTGVRLHWTRQQLQQARLVAKLRRAGMSESRIRERLGIPRSDGN